jgi:hypothetical protein
MPNFLRVSLFNPCTSHKFVNGANLSSFDTIGSISIVNLGFWPAVSEPGRGGSGGRGVDDVI